MSTMMVRPGIRLMGRMPTSTLLRASTPLPLRHLSTTIPRYEPSNALMPKTVERDEQRGPIVGTTGPGADGPHPSGTSSPSFQLLQPLTPQNASNPLRR